MDRKHTFYHADRDASLKEGQEIVLDENNLSRFGSIYWPVIQTMKVEEMDPAQKREYYLEQVKNDPLYHLYTSRLQCLFAANTIAEAILFANSIHPRPNHPIPIMEIFATKFWTLDCNWIDLASAPNDLGKFYQYWDGRIMNHRPPVGERKHPSLEVMIALPATAGKIVYIEP